MAVNPAVRERRLGYTRNNVVHAQHWRHDDGPHPTLCLIHGFMVSAYLFNGLFFSLPWFYRAGYDVLLYTLPFSRPTSREVLALQWLRFLRRRIRRLRGVDGPGRAGDRLAPPEQAEALWKHWDRCAFHWFPGNHILHVSQPDHLRRMTRSMRGPMFE